MKLNNPEQYQNVDLQLNEKKFSIGDEDIIFDILRKKIYSNPILAVCRELACNARDTHRAVGKGDVPIQISLPTYEEPFFRVKDEGEGISPERMEKIFIQYAVSTKRDDNTQQGYFGIGSKSPFGYTDNFSIITIFNGIEYNYSCFIDGPKAKLLLLGQSSTDQINGTEIIVPVVTSDITNFISSTVKSTYFWKIKPNFNLEIRYPEQTVISNNDVYGYQFIKTHNNNEIQIVVDDISYHIDNDILKSFLPEKTFNFIKNIHYSVSLRLYFNIGEISLSANREQIYLDQPTKDILADRMQFCIESWTIPFQEKINKLGSLAEANIELNRLIKTFPQLETIDFTWNTFLCKKVHVLRISCVEFTNQTNIRNKNKKVKKVTTHIDLRDRIKIIVNDSILSNDDLSIKHISKLLDEYESVYILPNSIEDDYLNQYNLVNLSSVCKSLKKPVPRTKVCLYSYNRHLTIFQQSSMESFNNDSKIKVLVPLRQGYKSKLAFSDNKFIDSKFLKVFLEANPQYSIYGFDESNWSKIKSEFQSLPTLQSVTEKYIDNLDVVKVISINSIKNNLSVSHHNLLRIIKKIDISLINSIITQNAIKDIFAFFNLIDENANQLDLIHQLNLRCEQNQIDSWIAQNFERTVDRDIETFSDHYPMIKYLDFYQFKTGSPIFNDVVNYINMIDELK